MKTRVIKLISKTYIVLLVTITLMGFAACGSEDIASDSIRLSETIKGEWYGQVDIAKMIYQALSDEIGIELSPNPAYCDVTLSFDENDAYIMRIDKDGLADAVGQCVDPYTSIVFGFDTSTLVNLIMQYVAKDIPIDTGEEVGIYSVDDEALTVTIVRDDGTEGLLFLNANGLLEYDDSESGQIIIFEKR